MSSILTHHQASGTNARMTTGLGSRPSRLAASRILSETAHDLRAPLTSVRESMRLVARGDFGAINDTQSQCLVDAMDLCDSMDRLIGDMLQVERLHTGRARVMRSWFDLEPICHQVASSLASQLRPRKISIVWDGIEPSTPRVFGDADKVARLLSNLISNAARETAELQSVLIRAFPIHSGETLRIMVIDSGKGLSLDAWDRLTRRGNSASGGEGLGITICRQIASLHHSPLTILSRLGKGTEISFDLPCGSASAVASHWIDWRNQQKARRLPRRVDAEDADPSVTTMSGLGFHRSFALPDTHLLMLNHDGAPPQNEAMATIQSVDVGATVPSKTVRAFNERLQRDQRVFDLVYQVSERRWVVVWDATIQESLERIEALSVDDPDSDTTDLRLTWSKPRKLDLASHSAAVMLADTLTRESLLDREPIARLLDDDMGIDGATSFNPSPIPAERLRAELNHLAKRLTRQSDLFAKQARATVLKPRT
jgi:nitrogen-specific signal transduction histidine kinase